MANSEKGEVALEVDGATYTLVMDINALVEFEGLFSTPDKHTPFQELAEKAGRGSLTHMRALIWAALRSHHGEMTLKDAGNLIMRAGGVAGMDRKFAELAQTMRPDAEDVKAGAKRAKTRP
jgi:hypothetical protein